jgi:hypothetical protein
MKQDAENEVKEPFYPKTSAPHFGNVEPCHEPRGEKLVEAGFAEKNGIFAWEGED